MLEFLKDKYYNSTIGRFLIHPFIVIRNNLIPLKVLLKYRFKRSLGYSLNLNNPKSFNEKIQWLKLNDRSHLHILCADKYAVRQHVSDKIGSKHLIPLILATQDPEEVQPEKLPDYPVIIKTNHGSGGVNIIKDKTLVNWSGLRKNLRRALKNKYDYSLGEWQYQKIQPYIVIEKLLLDGRGQIPNDYKLHCFNGKVAFIQVDMDRATNHRKNIYDADWNFIDVKFNFEIGGPVERPQTLEEMIRLAEIFAKDFIYVRVDFYEVNNHIYFGELTFHPASGMGKFEPQIWDFTFGEMLKLPFNTSA